MYKQQLARLVFATALFAVIGVSAYAAPTANDQIKSQAIQRMKAENAGANVRVSPSTGTASFVRLRGGTAPAPTARSRHDDAMAFVGRNAQAFGLRIGSADLKLRKTEQDSLGRTHLSYVQEYAGLPVFGASLKVHFDASNQLSVVSGTLVPDITVSAAPSRSAADAQVAAVKFVKPGKNSLTPIARKSRLLIFREGLARGVPGDSYLAYEVEVGNGADIREFVYVDAHTGKVIDQITGTPDVMNRRAYDGLFLPVVPDEYPDAPFWVEGQGFPTGVDEADNMILASMETYDFFSHAFGRDSFDGAGATMDSIFNRGYGCPNASWNGVFISFCTGLTTDDITGHEWAHAYTEYTDGLIYAWQSGALNEAYSDIVGETVDMINGRGLDLPNEARTAGSCSVFGGSPPPTLTITGGSAAGSYVSTTSVNEPPLPVMVGPLPMATADPADACAAIADVTGQVVLIDWEINGAPSVCGSGTRAANAIAANAAGIIFVAPASGFLNLGSDAGIASVQVSNADGATIKAGLPADATMALEAGTDNSVAWLLGEETTGFGGAIRDMWNPQCYGNPGKVSDVVEYVCSTSDQGGVHTNSGIDNHAYALMVDGGEYNGQTISPIGLMKASHIYFYAKTHYQGPATNFAEHADALEQSCADLIGTDLASLLTGSPSGQSISTADCDQVASAILAVEMRTEPTQCNFQPILAKEPPPLCSDTQRQKTIFSDGFEGRLRWRTSNQGTTRDFTPREWIVADASSIDHPGNVIYGPAQGIGTCLPGGDETAVLHIDSPNLRLPRGNNDSMLAFDHWIATEPGWDGGNLKIKVNNGPWIVVEAGDFIYNPYNLELYTAAQGNTNPIGGEPAFSGTDGGSLEGSWGRSIINLRNYAGPGDKIRLRFDIGNDGCGGNVGWAVDDVTLYQCR